MTVILQMKHILINININIMIMMMIMIMIMNIIIIIIMIIAAHLGGAVDLVVGLPQLL